MHQFREPWLMDAVSLFDDYFKNAGHELPPSLRVTCGFPSHRALSTRSRSVGQCWDAKASKDGTTEVMVSPTVDDGERVLGILAHELCHAAAGIPAGHKGVFRTLAIGLGLQGPMTHTTEGPAFKQMAQRMLAHLGPYPHATLDSSMRKKQSTRLVKCVCDDCGYVVRTTRHWIDSVGAPHCPHHGEMTVS